MVDLDRRPVQFDDQQRLDIERIAHLHEILRRLDGRPVHHFHAAGDDAGGDDIGDALPGILRRGKADEQGARRLGLFQDADGHFGDDAEQALRSGHQAEQVIALGIQVLAPDADHLAGDQRHLDAEKVVGGEAVFEAVHAARVLRHIAADGTGDLRGGIGRVIEALAFHRLGDGEIGDARLHHRGAVVIIDIEDAVELAHAQEHSIGERQRTAREARSGAARHHPDAVVVAILEDGADLRRGLRQNHAQGKLAIGRQPVGFEHPHFARLVDDPFARHHGPQGDDDFAPPIEHRGIRRRHPQGGHGCTSDCFTDNCDR